jgi:hypothetical protein
MNSEANISCGVGDEMPALTGRDFRVFETSSHERSNLLNTTDEYLWSGVYWMYTYGVLPGVLPRRAMKDTLGADEGVVCTRLSRRCQMF